MIEGLCVISERCSVPILAERQQHSRQMRVPGRATLITSECDVLVCTAGSFRTPFDIAVINLGQGTHLAGHRKRRESADGTCVCVSAVDFRHSGNRRQSLGTAEEEGGVKALSYRRKGVRWTDGRTGRHLLLFRSRKPSKTGNLVKRMSGGCSYVKPIWRVRLITDSRRNRDVREM